MLPRLLQTWGTRLRSPAERSVRLRVALAYSLSLILLLSGLTVPASIAVEAESPVDALLKQMPLDQRVGQMFMVSVFGEGLNDTTRGFLNQMMPGGIAYFSSNGTTPQKATLSVNGWQEVAVSTGARVPLLIAVDHEGGPVLRLTDGFTPLPWGAALGAMASDSARLVGRMAAEELRAVGIHMNLAPVADVRARSMTERPLFMERRTFGFQPARVGQAVAAFVQGSQESGVIATLKHFPGHGSAGDSHQFLPELTISRKQIEENELLPFQAGITAGADAIMVGHLKVPALDDSGLPATLSKAIITDLLRGKLGYTGLVMTDAMDMGAIVDNYTAPRAAVMAVQAGIDLMATGPNMPLRVQLEMRQAVLDAVKAGEIPAAQIEDSVRRILNLKAKYNLLTWQPLDPITAPDRLRTAAHAELLESIYLNTVAVAFDFPGLLPLDPSKRKVAVVFPGVYPAVGRICAEIGGPATRSLAFSLRPSAEEMVIARQHAAAVDVIVVFTYNLDEYPGQAMLVNNLPPEKTVVVALQNPYDFERGIQPGAYVALFNPTPPAFRAACAVLYGKHKPVGAWPVIQG